MNGQFWVEIGFTKVLQSITLLPKHQTSAKSIWELQQFIIGRIHNKKTFQNSVPTTALQNKEGDLILFGERKILIKKFKFRK